MTKKAKDIKVGDYIYIDIGYGPHSFETFVRVIGIQITSGLFDPENNYLNFRWDSSSESSVAGPYKFEDIFITKN